MKSRKLLYFAIGCVFLAIAVSSCTDKITQDDSTKKSEMIIETKVVGTEQKDTSAENEILVEQEVICSTSDIINNFMLRYNEYASDDYKILRENVASDEKYHASAAIKNYYIQLWINSDYHVTARIESEQMSIVDFEQIMYGLTKTIDPSLSDEEVEEFIDETLSDVKAWNTIYKGKAKVKGTIDYKTEEYIKLLCDLQCDKWEE